MVQGQGWKLTIAVALLGAAMVGDAFAAGAASAGCRELEARLAAASGSGNTRLVGKYDDAIVQQGRQIDIARRQARQAGCGFALFGGASGRCAEVDAALKRMNANLEQLRNKRGRLAAAPGRRERARIMAALDARGCRKKNEVTIIRSTPAPDRPAEKDGGNAGVVIRRSGDGLQRLGGEYRTLCVRTCDGYFFPMSRKATAGDFQRDQARCAAACPGTDVEMFYAQGGEEEPGSMISSVTGSPYAQLPRAFVYKRLDIAREPACSCGAAQETSVVGPASGMRAPAPVSRPGSSIVEAGVPKPPAAPGTAATEPVERELDEDRKVRVVGPTFLPDPQEAIDLQAPAPTQGP